MKKGIFFIPSLFLPLLTITSLKLKTQFVFCTKYLSAGSVTPPPYRWRTTVTFVRKPSDRRFSIVITEGHRLSMVFNEKESQWFQPYEMNHKLHSSTLIFHKVSMLLIKLWNSWYFFRMDYSDIFPNIYILWGARLLRFIRLFTKLLSKFQSHVLFDLVLMTKSVSSMPFRTRYFQC